MPTSSLARALATRPRPVIVPGRGPVSPAAAYTDPNASGVSPVAPSMVDPMATRPVVRQEAPRSADLARALQSSALSSPKNSFWEAAGGLAQLWAGKKAENEYLAAEQEKSEAAKAADREKLRGLAAALAGTTDPNERARMMIDAGVGVDTAFSQLLETPKPAEGFTLSEGQIRYDANGNPIAGAAKPGEPFTLGEGQVRYDAEGNPVAGIPKAPEEAKPYTDVGKIQADLANGIITEEQAAAAIKKATEGEPAYRQITDPAERAKYGIPPEDTGIYQVNPETNKIEKVGGASTSVTINNEKLTEAQSKDVNFYARGRQADVDLGTVENALTSLPEALWSRVPIAGNYQLTPEYQEAQRAAREFLAVILRKDTGAAVTPAEFELYGPMYLPAPGDLPGTVEAKRKARARALNAMKIGLGTAKTLGEDIDKQIVYPPGTSGGDVPPPPAGIDPDVWGAMTPEERALWSTK